MASAARAAVPRTVGGVLSWYDSVGSASSSVDIL